MRRFELALPSTVPECLAALSDGSGEVKVIAGGTDLLPQMKNGLVRPSRVVDLSGIPELRRLDVDSDGALHIGAAVSAHAVELAEAARNGFLGVAEGAGVIGSYQVRNLATVVESSHDARGIVWPMSIAPYEVVVTIATGDDPATVAAAESIYAALGAAGVDVLLDDRDERPGVKFADAELIGIPYRVTVGRRGIAAGEVEVVRRRDGEVERLAPDAAVRRSQPQRSKASNAELYAYSAMSARTGRLAIVATSCGRTTNARR